MLQTSSHPAPQSLSSHTGGQTKNANFVLQILEGFSWAREYFKRECPSCPIYHTLVHTVESSWNAQTLYYWDEIKPEDAAGVYVTHLNRMSSQPEGTATPGQPHL